MLTVHHLGISQSDRIVWLCEELGLSYRLERYDRLPTGFAPPAYKALHPQGTAPIIVDGELVLAESGAIITYLIAKYGEGRFAVGADEPGFADYLYWYHFSNSTMMPAEMGGFMAKLTNAADHPLAAGTLTRSRNAYGMIEKRLGEVDYFAGDAFTAADIMMVFPLTTMRRFVRHDLTAFPNIRAYLARIGAREAYRKAMQKADPEMEPLLT